MATHSIILAWRIPWTEEPDGLQSMGSQSQTRLKRPSKHTHLTIGLPNAPLPLPFIKMLPKTVHGQWYRLHSKFFTPNLESLCDTFFFFFFALFFSHF